MEVIGEDEGSSSLIHQDEDKGDDEGSSSKFYQVEDNAEVNPDAYEPQIKAEQVGVAHLVQGWIQRGNAARVFFSPLLYLLVILKILGFRGFSYRVISHVAAPPFKQRKPTSSCPQPSQEE